MIIKFDLLNNSIDYLENSLLAYIQANENGEYGVYADKKNKSKFKVSFVLLCQAMELLLKYRLQSINSALVYDNIDQKINEDSKTVDASKLLFRLDNLFDIEIVKEESDFIRKCFRKRNRYIHFGCEIDCERIKGDYAKLFVIYSSLYELFTKNELKKLDFANEQCVRKAIEDLICFDKNLIVFRGEEVPKQFCSILQSEIEFNQKYHILRDQNKKEYNRIKYIDNSNTQEGFCRYCGDCSAADGEFHGFGCDFEQCPKCGNQLISCDCNLKLVCEKELLDINDYYKKMEKRLSQQSYFLGN